MNPIRLGVMNACVASFHSFIAHEAAAGLGRIALKPEMCVPALVGCLTNSFVRYPAMRALARFGKDARPALPALENALSDRDPFFRAAAARAIRDITAGEPEAQQW
jgi:HEAT repeat protein